MLKRVREKTWVVLGRREARTVEAIRAALVEREAGNLEEAVRMGVLSETSFWCWRELCGTMQKGKLGKRTAGGDIEGVEGAR